MKKGAIELSFAWMFAIIIGVFILFIAIFFASKLIGLGEEQASAQTGKEIGILLNPLEIGFETAKSSSFTIPVESRIYGSCNLDGEFGNQLIKISQKSFKKWSETDLNVGFANKYIFNEDFVEGKKFYVFSKPFDFPFKVADLIYLTSSDKTYCFIKAPEEIQREINGINQKNLITNNCSANSVKVCFEDSLDCDILVDYSGKSISKNSGKVYFYGDALMYAGIFSSKEIYECQLLRLMKRINNLAEIYKQKINIISLKGCDSNLAPELSALQSLSSNVKESVNLGLSLISVYEKLNEDNDYNTQCKLW